VHKELIVASDGGDTVWTRTYDIRSGLPWPTGIGERVRRNRFVDQWEGREVELAAQPRPESAPADNPFEVPPDPETGEILYGQGAGSVDAVRPAAEVLQRLCADAEKVLRERSAALTGP